jgi:hypothetical protein
MVPTKSHLLEFICFVNQRNSSGYSTTFATLAGFLLWLENLHCAVSTATDHVLQELPVYYEVILDPMDLAMITRRLGLQRGGYKAWQDVFVDLDIMFANALHFNEPGSQVRVWIVLGCLLPHCWNVLVVSCPPPPNFSFRPMSMAAYQPELKSCSLQPPLIGRGSCADH